MKTVSHKTLDKAINVTGLSEYAIAKKIGVSQTVMYRIKTTHHELNDNALIQLAQIAQLNPLEVLADKHMKTAKGSAESAFWSALSKSKAARDSLIDCILCSIQPQFNPL